MAEIRFRKYLRTLEKQDMTLKLSEIPIGTSVRLAEFGYTTFHLQLLAMGVGPGTVVRLIRRLPLRGNLYLQIGTRRLVLRHSEAEQLIVTKAA